MNPRLKEALDANRHILWPNLARFNNLMIILNISLFFLTGLIAQGYYFTFISIGCFTLVGVLMILPFPCISQLWFYTLNLLIELTGLYFLIASVVYWIQHGGVPSLSIS